MTSKLNPVVHQNFITDKDDSVFCKKNHKVDKLSKIQNQCLGCPYFYGTLQGSGVECGWEDVITEPIMAIIHPQKELLRVSKLVDDDIIKKG